MRNLFDICTPRKDVLRGHVKESDFAADLAQVLNRNAPPEYQEPSVFFSNTHPTRGLRDLLKNVGLRLIGQGGEASAIFRLDTQYGGGKTHALIALSHMAQGMPGVAHVEEFVDPQLIPKNRVRVAAFDGENADPVNGRPLGQGLRAYTPWGEIAYALGGVEGFEQVRESDQQRVAPGAENLRALFGGEPSLILLDELSVYLRKVKGRAEAEQLTPFLTALFKAIESSTGAALVFTLAIGKGGKATDAYSAENEFVMRQLDEAESVAARKATVLDPTAEHETAQVLRRRLFANIDPSGAAEIIAAYKNLWVSHSVDLPPQRPSEDRESEFVAGFPFHPALMCTLTDKLSTLANFQRVRGMLRLLTQTVAHLWEKQPKATYAIHLHHLDPSYEPTRGELVTRLEMSSFDPAIRNDVAAAEGGQALAQQLDGRQYAGLAPYGSYVARTILWHTFAFNEELKGVGAEELRYSILAPGLDVGFINDARQKFVTDSAYLDDRAGIPLRFLAEANLNQIIRREEGRVDLAEAGVQLKDRIRAIFSGPTLNLVPFAGGAYDAGDDIGDGRPHLVLIGYDAATVTDETLRIPDLVTQVFKHQGSQNAFRQLQNNLVFLVADEALREEMKARIIRRLALESLRRPARLSELAEHQQRKVQELYQRSEQELALSIQQCYRHLFYPSRSNRVERAQEDLGHTAFDVPSASEKPGAGQQQVLRALKDMNKLLLGEDHPLAPAYVRDQTPLKKGQISTAELRAEFRKDPRLPILIGDDNFVAMVRKGIAEGAYVYKSGELLAGEGDPWCDIKVDQNSFVYTITFARENNLWPRPAPKLPEPRQSDLPLAETMGTYTQSRKRPSDRPPSRRPPPPGAKQFKSEAPLREALGHIWQESRNAKAKSITALSLRVFDAEDAFRLLAVVGAIPAALKRLEMTGEYETESGSAFYVKFEGIPKDAEPLKEFLAPQFRAAVSAGVETNLQTTYTITFEGGLSLAGDAAEKFTERLARFASGSVFVEAQAEAQA